MSILALKKIGRCANGAERDTGSIYHAVENHAWSALCKAKPGRMSAGWSSEQGERVTCPRCIKKLKALTPTRPA